MVRRSSRQYVVRRNIVNFKLKGTKSIKKSSITYTLQLGDSTCINDSTGITYNSKYLYHTFS